MAKYTKDWGTGIKVYTVISVQMLNTLQNPLKVWRTGI